MSLRQGDILIALYPFAYSVFILKDQFALRLGINNFKYQQILYYFWKDIYLLEVCSLGGFGIGFVVFVNIFSFNSFGKMPAEG